MTWQTHQLLAALNLLLCAAIGWACICRLNSEICRRYKLSRARYSLLLAGALSSGLQPVLWDSWTGVADNVFAGCVLGYLVINVVRWHSKKEGNHA